MAATEPPINSLPNEILLAIVSSFPNPVLLPLTLVSRRFQALAVRVLHQRLLAAATLPEHDLILECYHPSAAISTPYLYCRYLSTDLALHPRSSDGSVEVGPDLSGLTRSYTRFRPVVGRDNRRPRSRYPRRSALAPSAPDEEPAEESPTQDVHLDESELFSQLCTITNLVKKGLRHDVWLSHVNMTDDIIRVWRDWLAASAARNPLDKDENDILWADRAKTVGLRFKAQPTGTERMPLLVGAGEDPPVSYTLTYQELLVRTTKLLLAMERSAVQQVSNSDNAIILAVI